MNTPHNLVPHPGATLGLVKLKHTAYSGQFGTPAPKRRYGTVPASCALDDRGLVAGAELCLADHVGRPARVGGEDQQTRPASPTARDHANYARYCALAWPSRGPAAR